MHSERRTNLLERIGGMCLFVLTTWRSAILNMNGSQICRRFEIVLIMLVATWPNAFSLKGAEADVSIVDFAFNPASVTIQVNDNVVWTWVGPTPHTSTSNGGLWDSGLMIAASPKFSNTFKTSGSFPYFCALHPFMTASVTVNPAGPSGADLGISVSSTPNPVLVSKPLTYTLVITNAGPQDAADVIVSDSLPINAGFVSASASQGSTTPGATVLQWDAGPLRSGTTATASLVVLPLSPGVLTNTASLIINDSAVADPNPANNTVAVLTTVNGPGSTNVSVRALSPIEFDRQTGLFEQAVRFSNLSDSPIGAVRVSVLDLPKNVVLYNASGSTNGIPFVEYDHQISAGATIDFVLEYYSSNRLDFVSTNFAATIISPAIPAARSGTVVQLDRDPFLFNGKLVIEFATVPGATYVVQYSPNLQNWTSAVPALVAAGTRVQWIDAGPPKTESAPGTPGGRFYRVVRLP